MLVEPSTSCGKGYKFKDQMTLRVVGLCYAKGGIATYGWMLSEGINGLRVIAMNADVAAMRGSKFSSPAFAAYVGLGRGLRWLTNQGWDGDFIVQTDCQAIVDHFDIGLPCQDATLKAAHDKCRELFGKFGEWRVEHLERIKLAPCVGIASTAYTDAMKAERKAS